MEKAVSNINDESIMLVNTNAPCKSTLLEHNTDDNAANVGK